MDDDQMSSSNKGSNHSPAKTGKLADSSVSSSSSGSGQNQGRHGCKACLRHFCSKYSLVRHWKRFPPHADIHMQRMNLSGKGNGNVRTLLEVAEVSLVDDPTMMEIAGASCNSDPQEIMLAALARGNALVEQQNELMQMHLSLLNETVRRGVDIVSAQSQSVNNQAAIICSAAGHYNSYSFNVLRRYEEFAVLSNKTNSLLSTQNSILGEINLKNEETIRLLKEQQQYGDQCQRNL